MKLNIYKNQLLLCVMLAILVEPSYFRTLGTIHSIYTMGKYAVFFFVLCLTVLRKRISRETAWVFAFYGVIFVSTLFGTGSIRNYIISISGSMAICLIFSLWLDKEPDVLLNAYSILEIYVYINLITILLYPNGMYRVGDVYSYSTCWFLGYKNPQVRTILPILCVSLIRSYRNKGKLSINAIILCVASALTMFLNGSSTGLVGIAAFLILLFLFHKKYKALPRAFTLMNMLIGTVTLFIGIVIFRVQELFAFLIVGVLGKDLDFTNRAGIWNAAIEAIGNRWFLGYGHIEEAEYISLLRYHVATHPHNYFLYVCMNGGIILVIVLFYGFFRASRSLNKSIENVYSKIILFTISAFLLMGLTESLVSTVLLYPMLVLAMKAQVFSEMEYENKPLTIFGKKLNWGKKRGV